MSEHHGNPQTLKADDLTGLRCPKCDYDLTGLTKTQCPECGTTFDVNSLHVPKSKHLELHPYYVRFIRNVAVANLSLQLLNRILLENEVLLEQRGLVTYEFVENMLSLGLFAGLLGGSVGVVAAFGVIAISGVRYETRASLNGLATLLLSAVAAYLSLMNKWG